MSEHNGNPTRKDGDAVGMAPQITLTVDDLTTFHVKVVATVPTLDYALNMLDTARRFLESQWRFEQAKQLQRKEAQAIADAQLRASLQGSNLRA